MRVPHDIFLTRQGGNYHGEERIGLQAAVLPGWGDGVSSPDQVQEFVPGCLAAPERPEDRACDHE